MSRAAIHLGSGHPPGDGAGRAVLDVHLHPDCPGGPLSLGEQWGRVSGAGAQFTLQEAAEREAAHLRACGCDWLVTLAAEERQRGQEFSPEEILARRPAPVQVASAPKTPVRAAKPPPEVLDRIRAALASADYEALEGLRSVITEAAAEEIVRDWHPALPWPAKDAFAALLQDQTDPCVRPVFRDALHSPSPETRAYALCVLTGDFAQFTSLLTDGWVDEAKVDAAIAAAALQ